MERDTMLFYSEWCKAISELSVEKRCEVYEALFDYAFEHKPPEDALISAITHIMRIKIDNDQAYYDAKCERNRENGKKGGRPKKSTETHKNPTETQKNRTVILRNPQKPNHNPFEPTETHRNPYMTYDNMTYEDKDKSLSKIDAKASSSFGKDASAEVEQKKEVIDWEKFKEFYNSELAKHDARIPKIAKITKERKTYVLARIKEHGKEAVFKVIQKAAGSDFMNGHSDRAWVADFDWIFRPRNFPKILEGNYDNRDSSFTQITQQINGTTSIHRSTASSYEQRQNDFARHITDKLTSPDPKQPDLSGNY